MTEKNEYLSIEWLDPWVPIDSETEEWLASEGSLNSGNEGIADTLSDELRRELGQGHSLYTATLIPLAYNDFILRDEWSREILFSTDDFYFSVRLTWEQCNRNFSSWQEYQSLSNWVQRMERDHLEVCRLNKAWNSVDWDEHSLIWDRFDGAFDFKPDYHERKVPAISEPSPSVVLDLSSIEIWSEIDFLNNIFARLFRELVGCDESLLVLDWHHESFRFRPHIDTNCRYWPTIVYPDGDYYIFVSEDFSFGTFGHPWQESLCIFGQSLVDLIPKTLTEKFPVIRNRC